MNDPRYLPAPIDPRFDPRWHYPVDPRWQGYPPPDRHPVVQGIDQQAVGWPGWGIPPRYPVPQFPPPEYTIPYPSFVPPAMNMTPFTPPVVQIYDPLPWSTMPPELLLPQPLEQVKTSAHVPQSVWICLLLLLVVVILPFAVISLSKGGPSHVLIVPSAQSRTLTRINQWETSQYDAGQYVYAPSACSAAAMTEVVNYYSTNRYRIADILAAEIDAGAISSDLGLLDGYQSVHDTIVRFNAKYGSTFMTKDVSGSSLDTVIHMANQGTPVMVGWPPALWSGGHLLVVRGGDDQQVNLADSSSYDIKVLSRATFLKRWGGFAVIIEPQ